jgi:hypothetical protein
MTSTCLCAKSGPSSFTNAIRRRLGRISWATRFPRSPACPPGRRNDEEFSLALYRLHVPAKQWQEDVIHLGLTIADPEALCRALRRRHPEYPVDVVPCFHELLLERGQDVLPYVLENLDGVAKTTRGQGAFWLLGLARKFGWDELTSALFRTCCGQEQFNCEIARLLDNTILSSDPAKIAHRLRLLAGASRQLSSRRGGSARMHALSEANAVQLYRRFPELLLGPLRRHLTRQTWDTERGELLTQTIVKEDESFIDQLAAGAVTWLPHRSRAGAQPTSSSPGTLERLVQYYEPFRADSRSFAQRAASILGRLPASAIGAKYRRVVRGNPLARLFFEESLDAFSSVPELMRDLLEASEINVQALALRILAREERADAATENVDLLAPLLLAPLKRRVRLLAFSALLNAAATPQSARLIHERARQALVLPAKGYPREPLIGLIGRLLHRWPELRRPNESPIIHARRP